ncbi:MAG: exonuclease SbcCD subunit D C-terminal domain-containing protein [Magnetococcales bacterium]|nr:exonuclease SbcCD subunit D C-terminal domain-containing protein [Magnetococcales bacterium]MBF0116226.1 exonuclease SbcCD subunit D C-terminal domain-containing protein [Magnetococcales bacterium]
MKVLHTSDWHLGRSLYGRERYDAFAAFLTWLVALVEEQEIAVLLVAGDVFDSHTPSHRAQTLYYHFLSQLLRTSCRHVVITAGNHDSPSLLEAPQQLLRALDVQVIGRVADSLDEEVILLKDRQGQAELIVCAVPYLRDREMRVVEAGESVEDKERKLQEGIRQHYAAVAALAEQKRQQWGAHLPIVAMGHLFAAGGQVVEGDGVRDLYVGSLLQLPAGIFADCFDYVALGHLHVAQKVNHSERIQYSGSPLPMGFGEASQQKSVQLLSLTGRSVTVQRVAVPVFQPLQRLKGDWAALLKQIKILAAEGASAWLEIIYEGAEVMGDLRERLDQAVADSQMVILRVRNDRVLDQVRAQVAVEESIDDLDVYDLFERCLVAHKVPEEQRAELHGAYREIMASWHEEDAQAE